MSRHSRTTRRAGAIAAAEVQHKPIKGEPLAFQVDMWTRRLVRPLLIAALATSVSIALLEIIRLISPQNAWLALVPLCFFIALEGAYTAAWLNTPDSFGVDRLGYRLAETLLILVVVRIYSWIFLGGGIPSPEELRGYLTAPLSILTVSGFLTSAFVTLVAWSFAVSNGRIFTKLDVSIYEIRFYRLSQPEQKAMGDDRPIQVQRGKLLSAYFRNWLAVGMAMIILAALSTFEVRQFATVSNPLEITRLGLSSAMLLALIIYFLAGFWLLSHGRLLRMNARWLADGMAKEVDLERGWQRSSLIILLTIAAIAAFLPIGSTLPISRILSLGVSVIAYLAGVIIQAIGYLLAMAIMMLTGNIEESDPVRPPQLTLPSVEEVIVPPSNPSHPFAEMMVSSIFWTLVIAAILATLFYFLRERGYTLQRERIEGQWQIVIGWLRELWAQLTGRIRSTSSELRSRLKASKSAANMRDESQAIRTGFLRLGNLSPRDQIRYYYLALVHRAGERGIRRGVGQTPLEYARELKETWPESEGEIDDITTAFVTARYSSRPLEKSDALTSKQQWRLLRRRLRKPG